ncbi:hypothetical protein [Photobacterium damselae]|uniref:hypothetical protein n=1 Tax=Photobacterium damselae TaxID=38293 RepID=UPI001F32F4B9|nr:hypothetical protein [Photobacterium damselae]UKA03972.1 hypothetical protein IHC89_15700 [Photobacterium damselae subsp. damselae]
MNLQEPIFKLPQNLARKLRQDSDPSDDFLEDAHRFFSTLDIKRVGFNGLKINNQYEFIFKIEGDKILEQYTEYYEYSTSINMNPVRIGSPSDLSLLVIMYTLPALKNYYLQNELCHYLSISFSCKEKEAATTLFYAQALVNRILSRGGSFILPDDIFKPDDVDDQDEFAFIDDPTLGSLIRDFQGFEEENHTPVMDDTLYRLIAKSYHVKEELRFISYFRIIEYLSRKQKKLRISQNLQVSYIIWTQILSVLLLLRLMKILSLMIWLTILGILETF